jgi:glycosyltransferase involved in cell wall biosynthesis
MRTPPVSILIPFRDNGDRTAQFDWLQARWRHFYPGAQIIVAQDDGSDPFSKTMAVNNAYQQATSDVLAMVDADVWLDPHLLTAAATTIRNKRSNWVQPCSTVARLSEDYTRALIQRDPSELWTPNAKSDAHGIERSTNVVGLVAVFSRKAFEDVGGMDPRFRGWGWEDNAFNAALATLHGKPRVWKHTVWHLWHPRTRNDEGRPIWPGQTDRNNQVGSLYSAAKGRPALMRKLAREVQGLTGIKP